MKWHTIGHKPPYIKISNEILRYYFVKGLTCNECLTQFFIQGIFSEGDFQKFTVTKTKNVY